jgi:Reverse transcriptase (RNA-dependent DNA polymerase)
MENGFK